MPERTLRISWLLLATTACLYAGSGSLLYAGQLSSAKNSNTPVDCSQADQSQVAVIRLLASEYLRPQAIAGNELFQQHLRMAVFFGPAQQALPPVVIVPAKRERNFLLPLASMARLIAESPKFSEVVFSLPFGVRRLLTSSIPARCLVWDRAMPARDALLRHWEPTPPASGKDLLLEAALFRKTAHEAARCLVQWQLRSPHCFIIKQLIFTWRWAKIWAPWQKLRAPPA